MNKFIKKALAIALSAGFVLSAGCAAPPTSNLPPQGPPTDNGVPVEATLRVGYIEDKILQTYDTTDALKKFGERFNAYLFEDFSISTFKNEYESRNVIITPDKNVESYDLTISDLTSGSNVLSKNCFDIRHAYYHEVSTIMSTESTMMPGMYPDAMIPLSAAKEYKINKIKANENQAVMLTVKVPETQPAGVYTGTITVNLDGEVFTKTATVEVLDYVLPEQVTVNSLVQLTTDNLAYLEADCTQEMYDKVKSMITDFRMGVQWLYGMNVGTNSEDVVRQIADEQIPYMLEAAQNPKVAGYGLTTNGQADTYYGSILNANRFMIYLKKYVDASVLHGVDLFKKAYVYMGSIIDEPDAWGTIAQERVFKVCAQYEQCLADAAAYAQEKGGSPELINSILNLTHIITTRIDSPASYDCIDTYCTEPQYYDSSAKVDDYREHRKNGGGYWIYTCCNPKTPYPTFHIDDNGVSGRALYWMMRDYDIEGYLMWDSSTTSNAYPDYNNKTKLHGIEQYEDVMRNNTDVGDGYMLYPGKVFGLDAPVPALRWFYHRDGAEDYDAISDLNNKIYPALADAYGVSKLSSDGVFDEIYGSLYNMNRVYCTSAELQKAKTDLNTLMVWANNGIAVSDFEIKAGGNVSFKVYAPSSVEVKVNGNVLSGTTSGTGKVYAVNGAMDTCTLEIASRTLTLVSKTRSILVKEASRITPQNKEQQSISANVSVSDAYGVDTLRIEATNDLYRILYSLDSGVINKNSKSLYMYVYLSAPEKIQLQLYVRGTNQRLVDTVYLHPGYNAVRFDRLCDLEWNKIKNANGLGFAFVKPDSVSTFTIDIEDIRVLG